MTSNVISFPQKIVETIDIEDELLAEENGNDFASEIIEHVHDMIHERTGDCIFTEEAYKPLAICLGEVLTAMYMFSQGHETHPFYDIAQDIFGDPLDISGDQDYTDDTDKFDEEL